MATKFSREEQLDGLTIIGNQFWLEFSQLCEKAIERAKALGIDEGEATEYLGEKTSIYGRKSR
jgi:hypothetical protein